jgi:hypothetical protein
MMRRAFFIAALVMLAAISGCSMVPTFAAAEGVSTVLTKKTITDHIVSLASGKNCSTVRVSRGQSYCVEDEINPPTNVYCYRTLGSVSCYNKRNPYNSGQKALGRDGSNLAKNR